MARKNASTIIEVDGGVTNKNAAQLLAAGADIGGGKLCFQSRKSYPNHC
ncbi:hypothetical protein [Flavobacterium sp.]